MAETTIVLTANEETDPIVVTPFSIVGLEFTDMINVKSKGGAFFPVHDVWARQRIIVPPNNQITLVAGPNGATVIVTTQD